MFVDRHNRLTMWLRNKLVEVANRLGANPQHLYDLIEFESKWQPQIKNPNSSARGLIQFIDSTAKDLGFLSSADLVSKNPTISEQLDIVERYLKKYAPFHGSKQSLYMSVFYPKYRSVPIDTVFPSHVLKVNKPLKTPRDYIAFVDKRAGVTEKKSILPWVIAAGAAVLLLNNKK